MRVYAVLLATTLTVGYAAVAQVALSSAFRTHRSVIDAARPTPGDAWADRVWYGGVLAPVTVTAVQRETRAACDPEPRDFPSLPGRSREATRVTMAPPLLRAGPGLIC